MPAASPTSIGRRRIAIGLALTLTIALGLASRRWGTRLPSFVAEYAGDTLWATAAYLGFALIFARWSVVRLAVVAMSFALAIELSQLFPRAVDRGDP